MEKVVIVKFPEDFEFPKTFMEPNDQSKPHSMLFNPSICEKCPLSIYDDVSGYYCLPIESFTWTKKTKKDCPFYDGRTVAIIKEGMPK